MNLYFVITTWAFLEGLQEPAPPARKFSRAVFMSAAREMTEIFFLTAGMAGFVSCVNAQSLFAQDYSAAAVMLLYYIYGKAFKRRLSFLGMAFACLFLLLQENSFSLMSSSGAEIALGVTAIRLILKGIQKRQLLFPIPPLFSGLPAFFVTAAILSMVLSVFFVR